MFSYKYISKLLEKDYKNINLQNSKYYNFFKIITFLKNDFIKSYKNEKAFSRYH